MKITAKKIAVVFFLFFISKNIAAQYTFMKTFGHPQNNVDEFVNDMTIDCWGNIYIVGLSNLNTDNFLVSKTDSMGNICWIKSYSNFLAEANKIINAKDSNLVIFGGVVINGIYSIGAIKIDTTGNLIWSKFYPFNSSPFLIYSAKELTNGDFLFTGQYEVYDPSTFTTQFIAYIIKSDSTLNLKWVKRLVSDKNSSVNDIIEVNDSLYITIGGIDSSGFGQNDLLIMSIDSSGSLLQSKILGSPGNDYGIKIFKTADQGFMIASVDDYLSPGLYFTPHFMKLDSTFHLEYNTKYYFNNFYYIESMLQLRGNSYVISGNDLMLFKIDSLFNYEWGKVYAPSGYNKVLYGVVPSKDNGFIAAGTNYQTREILLLKTDSMGDAGCYSYSLILNQSASPVVLDSSLTLTLSDTVLTYFVLDTIHPYPYIVDTLCFSTTGISEISHENEKINIFPNPMNAEGTIKYENDLKNAEIEIELINIFGQKLERFKKFSNQYVQIINVQKYPADIYILNFYLKNELLTQKKIIILK